MEIIGLELTYLHHHILVIYWSYILVLLSKYLHHLTGFGLLDLDLRNARTIAVELAGFELTLQ